MNSLRSLLLALEQEHTALPDRLIIALDNQALAAVSDLRLRLILLLYCDQFLTPAKMRPVLEGIPDLVYERAMIYGQVGYSPYCNRRSTKIDLSGWSLSTSSSYFGAE